MIERYSREEMTKIWDLNTKFDYYLQVELAVCDAYAKLGTIPAQAAAEIRQKAKKQLRRNLLRRRRSGPDPVSDLAGNEVIVYRGGGDTF